MDVAWYLQSRRSRACKSAKKKFAKLKKFSKFQFRKLRVRGTPSRSIEIIALAANRATIHEAQRVTGKIWSCRDLSPLMAKSDQPPFGRLCTLSPSGDDLPFWLVDARSDVTTGCGKVRWRSDFQSGHGPYPKAPMFLSVVLLPFSRHLLLRWRKHGRQNASVYSCAC